MTFDFDVAIVGGGPAGTSTALHLVRRERVRPGRIVLLEKATHPREKPCAGAVSAWGLEALDAIGVGVDVPHVAMAGLRVLAGGDVGAYRGMLGVVVRRREFDASLWRRAAGDGVVARDGDPVIAIVPIAGGWRLVTQAGAFCCRLLAACDGSGSFVRKALGLGERARKGHLYVTETPAAPCDDGPNGGLCDFDLRVADGGIEGYYWDFPAIIDGNAVVSRGIYHANFTPRPDLKLHFAAALAARGLDIENLRLKAFSTRPLVRGAPVGFERLVLVGEAAGIDRATGEGIAQAILTGALAAKQLARALRTGDGSLRAYGDDLVRSRVGRHLLQSAWLSRRVYGPRGGPWRSFLARDATARDAGAQWYAGHRLPWIAKARLAASLAWSAARDRS